MVHNRTMGFSCNFGWWRQQQTAFFQVKRSNFPLRKFQVASHNTEEWGWVYHRWSTRWTSQENLTHIISHRVHGRNSELCLSFFGYSLCINLLPVRVYQLKREYLFYALKPANCKHRPVGTFGVLLLCKQGAGFQPRLQFPPLFCIVLSANQV